MGCSCFTWSFKLWWYSKGVTTLSAWSENCEIVLLFDCYSTLHRLFFLGILMYGSGFLLWNLGELKISQPSAKLDPQRTRSALTWKECEVTCPPPCPRWPSFMDGGTCLRVGLSCLPPGPFLSVLYRCNRSHHFPFFTMPSQVMPLTWTSSSASSTAFPTSNSLLATPQISWELLCRFGELKWKDDNQLFWQVTKSASA